MGRPRKWQANPVLQKLVQDARQTDPPLYWLDLQNADRYKWIKVISQNPTIGDRIGYYRRLGIVEGLFDSDGSLSCGRADLSQNHIYEIQTSLTNDQLRERIVLAWTLMRVSHILLSSQSMFLDQIVPRASSRKWTEKCFLYHCPRSLDEAIEETRSHVRFVEDSYPHIDAHQFFQHLINTNRAVDSGSSLSRLHVLPFTRNSNGTTCLHFVIVFAHQITDGLTVHRWASHFAKILNTSTTKIKSEITALLSNPEQTLPSRLPPPQESIYPKISPPLPRQRWHWLLTRILRHVRTPLPPGFQNPLRRTTTREKSTPFPSLYPKVLDYTTTPPLNAGALNAIITHPNTYKLRAMCKKARISVGSGLFTLVGMVMMSLEESLHPDIPLERRLPFIGSFPVNPRPFLTVNTTGSEDSCMLAFSDGVVLPFLSADLSFAGRFKLLGRQAHRQLRQYQKRQATGVEQVKMGSRSPSQLLPMLFCSTMERLESRYTGDGRTGVDVQGAYPAGVGGGLATCGVSSVGDVSAAFAAMRVDGPAAGHVSRKKGNDEGDRDLVATLESMYGCVRPRDGEFLVGAAGDSKKDQFTFNVSFDMNAIDEERVWEWKGLMEGILDAVDVDIEEEVRPKL